MSAGTRLKLIRTMWGLWRMADGPRAFEEVIPVLADLGYTGIEAGLCHAMHYGPQRFKEVLKAHDMDLILMLFTSGPACPARYGIPGHSMDARDVQTHLTLFKEQAREAYDTFGDITLFCNSHSINDYFSWDEAHAFFDEALAFQEAEGLEVYHETHRKRWLHSPWVTRQFIQTYPQMKLVADLSHWINVAETDTEDPELTAAVAAIAPQVHHIHARVGYDHGPQVSDPRAPEWLPYTEGHERWWQMCWEHITARGDTYTTVTPEHGPPNYQQTLPHTRIPLADIWDVNHFLAMRQAKHYGALYGDHNTATMKAGETQGLS